MKTLKNRILPAIAIGLALAVASPAGAQEGEEVVPPENSAVNQYTEGFPTAAGEKDAHDRRGGKRTPDKILGTRKAERLEQQGPAGHAVAELTAETAPVAAVPVPEEESDAEETTAAAGRGDDNRGDRSASGKADLDSARQGSAAIDTVKVDGSSGPWSVIGQALGTSSGGMGLLLPLLLLATIAWTIAYAMRHRRVGH